ncbi:hypothetical protein [Streptomyces silvensis]|uniref:Uncharacterized protein n=1 Tax=Streptomyces silvensis TaxID=1765722 RepID=A0A0W7X7N0_9ACTN|nr:hypothetical protein [Streptomyces silvensis]KUF18847.1 hypothetical protein AT728_07375 [Streptomyces silvensis]
MSMADLVVAGAPELPEGWFYRVVSDGFFGLKVEVRERRKRFGSRVINYAYVRTDEPDGLTAVVASCRHAVKRIDEADREWRNRRDAAKYLGDHDPKGRK